MYEVTTRPDPCTKVSASANVIAGYISGPGGRTIPMSALDAIFLTKDMLAHVE